MTQAQEQIINNKPQGVSHVVRGKHLRAIDMLDSRTWTELELVAGWHDDKDQLLNDAVARLDKLDEAVKNFAARVKKVEKKIHENEEMFLKFSKEGERLFRTATAFGLRLGNFIDPHSPDHRIAERVLLIALDMTDPKNGCLKFEQEFNKRLRAVALNNLATVLAQAKRLVEALDRVQAARALEAELGPAAESPATTMFNEAQIYYLAGRSIEALQAFHATVQVLRQHIGKALGNREKATTGGLLLAALRQLAGICEATHRYIDAINTLEDALAVAREVEKATLHLNQPKSGSTMMTEKASDVVARDHTGRKMTAVREAIAADLKRCQRTLEQARNRPRGRIQIIDLPKPITFEEEAILQKLDEETRKRKFGPRSAAALHHHQDWSHSPAVLGGNVSCVAEAETLKLTKRSTSARHSPTKQQQDKALARVLAPISENRPKTASSATVHSSTKNIYDPATVLEKKLVPNSTMTKHQQHDYQQEKIFSENYAIKTEVPVPVSSIEDLVRSLPKNLQSAYQELQAKGVEAQILSKEPAPPKAKSHRPALSSQFSFEEPRSRSASTAMPKPSSQLADIAKNNTMMASEGTFSDDTRGGFNHHNKIQQQATTATGLVVRPPKRAFGGLTIGGCTSIGASRSTSLPRNMQALIEESVKAHSKQTLEARAEHPKAQSPQELHRTPSPQPNPQQQLQQAARRPSLPQIVDCNSPLPVEHDSTSHHHHPYQQSANLMRVPTPPVCSTKPPSQNSGRPTPTPSASATVTPFNSPRPTQPNNNNNDNNQAVRASGTTTTFSSSKSLPPRQQQDQMQQSTNSSSVSMNRKASSVNIGSSQFMNATGRNQQQSHYSPLSPNFAASVSGTGARTARRKSYAPKSVDDIMNLAFGGGGASPKGSMAAHHSSGRSFGADRGKKRREAEAYQAELQTAAEDIARKWKQEEEERKKQEESELRNRYSGDEAAKIIQQYLLARPCRVMVIGKQKEFLEKQVRLVVAEQRRSAILLAREEMQNTAMAKAATDFVAVWSSMQLTRTSRTPAMKAAADKAEESASQRRQSRETFLNKAKTVMEHLEKAELALAAKSGDHAAFLRRDTVAKFLKRSDGVRIMQALLRGVGGHEIRAEKEFHALTEELKIVRANNYRVAMATRLQRWFRSRLSLEMRKRAARERRAQRLAKLQQFQLLFSSHLRAQESNRLVYYKQVKRLNLCFSKFGAMVRGAALRRRLPCIRWDHARFMERKILQSVLVIQHAFLFWKLLAEFTDPFQGLDVEEVERGRRHFAACRIQSRFRSHLYGKPHTRRLEIFREKKEREMRVFIGTVSIQRWWHRAKAQALLRALKRQEASLKKSYEEFQLKRWAGNVLLKFLKWASKTRRDEAIASWEGEYEKKKFLVSEKMRERNCVIKIQRAFRMHFNYRRRVVASFDSNPPFGIFSYVDDPSADGVQHAHNIINTRIDVLREANLTRELREDHPSLIRSLQVKKATNEKRRRLSEQNMLNQRATSQDQQHQENDNDEEEYQQQQQHQDDDDDDDDDYASSLQHQEEQQPLSEEEQEMQDETQRVFRGFMIKKVVKNALDDALIEKNTSSRTDRK